MKVTVLSDLHLEFGTMKLNNEVMGADTLLLAGDVCVADYLRSKRTDKDARKHQKLMRKFFTEECAKYARVYYIMGNHEHYHGVFDYTADLLNEFLHDTNVTLLDKEWVDLPEFSLFGATMWTDYKKNDYYAKWTARKGMTDHEIIQKLHAFGGQTPTLGNFHPDDAIEDHEAALKALEDGLATRTDKTVLVMTHHAPTFMSVSESFRGSPLNPAYHSNLEDVMLDNPNVKYWFHGHMHEAINYGVGDCRVVCNPRGYAGYALNDAFVFDFTLEV